MSWAESPCRAPPGHLISPGFVGRSFQRCLGSVTIYLVAYLTNGSGDPLSSKIRIFPASSGRRSGRHCSNLVAGRRTGTALVLAERAAVGRTFSARSFDLGRQADDLPCRFAGLARSAIYDAGPAGRASSLAGAVRPVLALSSIAAHRPLPAGYAHIGVSPGSSPRKRRISGCQADFFGARPLVCR